MSGLPQFTVKNAPRRSHLPFLDPTLSPRKTSRGTHTPTPQGM